jgi:hypothetical protein
MRMTGTCGVYWRWEKLIDIFGQENLKERGGLENLGIDGRILLKCTFKIEWKAVDWIQDKNKFLGFVNTAIKPLGSV